MFYENTIKTEMCLSILREIATSDRSRVVYISQ